MLLGGIWTLTHFAGLVALIRLTDGLQDNGVWQVWKCWFRAGFLGWTKSAWRLMGIQGVIFLTMLPLLIPCFVCTGVPLFGDMIFGDLSYDEPVLIGRVLIVILLILLILIILSIPFSLMGPYVQIARRAAVLDGLGVFPSLYRGWDVMHIHWAEVIILWLMGVLINFAFWLVVVPILGILAVGGMVAAWVLGGGIYILAARILEPQISFLVAVGIGGLIFLAILILPFWLLDGLMSTASAVSWTQAYRKYYPVLQCPNEFPEAPGENES